MIILRPMGILFQKLIALSVLLTLIYSNFAAIASPEIIEDYRGTPLSTSRSEPFFVYVPYGDPSSKQVYTNAFITVTLATKSVQFLSNNLFEIIPDDVSSLSCSDATEGREYPIGFELVQDRTLQYGPKSAIETDGGLRVADIGNRSRGCLKLGIKVLPLAKEGEEFEISIEQLFAPSSGVIEEQQGIPKKIIIMAFDSPSVCPTGEEKSKGICVNRCASSEYRSLEGVCQARQPLCGVGTEIIAGECELVCPSGVVRNNFGECAPTSGRYTELLSRWVTGILVALISIVLCIVVLDIAKRAKKSLASRRR